MTTLVTLSTADSRLVLAPRTGGAIASWTLGARSILRPLRADALAEGLPRLLGGYPLFPYSGRVAGRRFTWDGITYELPALLGGHAIHGCGWQEAWQVEDATKRQAVLRLDHAPNALWPLPFLATQRFTLEADRLVCDLMIENRHPKPAPVGFGLHPYFPRSPATRLQVAAGHVWHNGADGISSERSVPPAKWDFSAGLPVGADLVDNCFGDWGGVAVISYPDLGYRLRIEADAVFRHLVIFVPEGQDFFAVEPVVNMGDGINRIATEPGQGMVVLPRGQRLTGQVRYIVEAG